MSKVKSKKVKIADNNFIKKIKSFFNNLSKLDFKKIIKIFKNKKVTIITVTTIVLFVLSVVGLAVGFRSLFFKQESKVILFDDDHKRFIQAGDVYIIDVNIVESGELLPDISSYFYKGTLLQENATILYYKDDVLLNKEDFTYEKDGSLYVRGTGEITVVIFNGQEYKTTLNIRDTTEPDVILREVTITQGDAIDVNNFIDVYNDNSSDPTYEAHLLSDIDISYPGNYDINFRVCDASNNCVTKTGTLYVERKPENNGGSGNNNGGSGNNNGGSGNNNGGSGSGNNNGGSGNNNGGSGNNNGGSGNNNGGSGNNNGGGSQNPPTPVDNREKEEAKKSIKSLIDIFSNSGSVNTDPAFIRNYEEQYMKIIKQYNPNLQLDSGLCSVARLRAAEISMRQYHNAMLDIITKTQHPHHVRPNGKEWNTILREYDLANDGANTFNSFNGEIYTATQYSIQEAMDDFMASPAHKEIIVDTRFKKVGVAKFKDKEGIYNYVVIFTK